MKALAIFFFCYLALAAPAVPPPRELGLSQSTHESGGVDYSDILAAEDEMNSPSYKPTPPPIKTTGLDTPPPSQPQSPSSPSAPSSHMAFTPTEWDNIPDLPPPSPAEPVASKKQEQQGSNSNPVTQAPNNGLSTPDATPSPPGSPNPDSAISHMTGSGTYWKPNPLPPGQAPPGSPVPPTPDPLTPPPTGPPSPESVTSCALDSEMVDVGGKKQCRPKKQVGMTPDKLQNAMEKSPDQMNVVSGTQNKGTPAVKPGKVTKSGKA
ncbi:hypothetical protein BDZ85DRAFT_256765 [Elsinoe ampelina]|uniref:Uncharacterized protein n=1 Tax=Elsinoe ampelina TaxID=302913 RepID=A0A6A6GME6_9PEZI|nr:hypothetical protein BDZ85DRAFT_256765 [Elsinoe ampelina]